MEQDFFAYLPSEIITDILSRLSVRTIAISMCVSKSWLRLLNSDYFVNFHLSKSGPTLAVLTSNKDSTLCRLFEIEEEINLESHDRRYNPLTNFDFIHRAETQGTSANALLLLHSPPETLCICNPITGEYIDLCGIDVFIPPYVTYGFGVSKISGQHKVVRIVPGSNCHVYTLGTGSWRSVALLDYPCYNERAYGCCSFAAFVNGNLHWAVSSDLDSTEWCVCCFDVETECFSTFSAPFAGYGDLSVLRDCLCFCDITMRDGIVLWMMKEYGVEKSWTKEYVMGVNPDFAEVGYGYVIVYPIRMLKNSDILMLWSEKLLLCYSNETKSTREIGILGAGDRSNYVYSMLLTPSLVSLKTFGMEDVISF